jgi:argininosuccinate lyase
VTTGHPILIVVETLAASYLFAREARRLGLQPVFFSAFPTLLPQRKEHDLRVVRVNPNDPAQMLEVARSLQAPVAGVCSGTDLGTEAAFRLAREFGLPCEDADVVSRARDKSYQRSMLQHAGLDTRPFRTIRSQQDLKEAAREIAFPAVLKPIRGTGSIGVRRCRDLDEALDHFASVSRMASVLHGADAMLLETSIEGPQYGVDMVDGEVLGITEKHYVGFDCVSAVAHEHPASVMPAQWASLAQFARAAAAACGLSRGHLHVELRRQAEDGTIRLIEINQRVPQNLVELVREVSGYNLIESVIRRAVAMPDPVPVAPAGGIVGRLDYLTGKMNSVGHAVLSAKQVRAIPGVQQLVFYTEDAKGGTSYQDNRNRIGHLICTGTSMEEVRQTSRRCLVVRSRMIDDSFGEQVRV